MPESASGPERSCEGCTLCCHILPINEEDVQKPANATCVNCIVGRGCGIYETRYQVCRRFMCAWVTQPHIGAHWQPIQSHMVLATDFDSAGLMVHVDAAYPDAWRQPGYIEDLRGWAANPTPAWQRVIIKVSDNYTVLFPKGEKFIGPMRAEQVLLVHKLETMFWTAYDAELVESGDPRAGNAVGRIQVAGVNAIRLDLPH